MLEESTSVEKISDLLLSSSHKSFQIAETNFRVGRLVQEVLAEHGESAVTELARTLAAKGVIASVGFLFDASRVFRTIKNEETLAEIKSKLNGKLSWGFLVNNCTRILDGNSQASFTIKPSALMLPTDSMSSSFTP